MEQVKIVGSFETYADGIDLYSLHRIASLLGIKSSSKYKKAELIAIVRDTLATEKVQLKMFSRYSRKYYRTFKYLISVLKHFEVILNLSHSITDELERLWSDYQENLFCGR